MIEANDIEQMAYLFGIEFNTISVGSGMRFESPMFGVRIIFAKEDVLARLGDEDRWRTIYISSRDTLEEKKMEVIWELMRAGYMHYLRTEVPRTFREMITNQGWDRKIIEKRLELYGDGEKYAYLKELNRWSLTQPATYILSIDPGFFDFLV